MVVPLTGFLFFSMILDEHKTPGVGKSLLNLVLGCREPDRPCPRELHVKGKIAFRYTQALLQIPEPSLLVKGSNLKPLAGFIYFFLN